MPNKKFLEPTQTLRRDQRFGTYVCRYLPAAPYDARRRVLRCRHPPASSLELQPRSPAVVALPGGWMGQVKVEGDD
jgi:hypothetical protein